MTIIFLLIFIALFVLVFVVSILTSVISGVLSLFGFGRKRNRHYTSAGGESEASRNRREYTEHKAGRKKLFAEDEGEYVDFEEMKD